jgi:hypothetical protein
MVAPSVNERAWRTDVLTAALHERGSVDRREHGTVGCLDLVRALGGETPGWR